MPIAYNGEKPIYYTVEGHGEPLVLLHGFMNDHLIWYDLSYVRSLKTDYKLILVDLRGHGQSYKPHDPDEYYLTHRVKDIIAVMDTVKVRKAHIMGYSMGGRVAFGFAKYSPDRVRSLIIGGMSPFGRIPIDMDQRIKDLEGGMKASVINYEKQYGPLPNAVRERILKNDSKALIAATMDTRDWQGIAEVLPEMSMPVLYFCGENDLFYKETVRAAKLIPDVNFISIPDANHQQAYVKKHLILPQIIEFLEKN
ncbi:MAG: alpha/beta fold hydrolase [Candidatus Heimdallarchaeota archaeon]|nr:alpha/beta fold hydrolase [Candidatus Heimdallarchaeota archaeon]